LGSHTMCGSGGARPRRTHIQRANGLASLRRDRAVPLRSGRAHSAIMPGVNINCAMTMTRSGPSTGPPAAPMRINGRQRRTDMAVKEPTVKNLAGLYQLAPIDLGRRTRNAGDQPHPGTQGPVGPVTIRSGCRLAPRTGART